MHIFLNFCLKIDTEENREEWARKFRSQLRFVLANLDWFYLFKLCEVKQTDL